MPRGTDPPDDIITAAAIPITHADKKIETPTENYARQPATQGIRTLSTSQ